MAQKRADGTARALDARHRTAEEQMAWMYALGRADQYAADHPDDPAPMRVASTTTLNDVLRAFRSIGAGDPRRTDALAWLGEMQDIVATHRKDPKL